MARVRFYLGDVLGDFLGKIRRRETKDQKGKILLLFCFRSLSRFFLPFSSVFCPTAKKALWLSSHTWSHERARARARNGKVKAGLRGRGTAGGRAIGTPSYSLRTSTSLVILYGRRRHRNQYEVAASSFAFLAFYLQKSWIPNERNFPPSDEKVVKYNSGLQPDYFSR